eukprot:5999379-Amphidinium_carterae.1
MLLRHLGLDDNQVRMLWQLLDVRDVAIIWRGMRYRGLRMCNGVAQGNPLSAWIYNVAFDSFIRLVNSQLRPKEVAVAFADDVTLILSELDRLHDVLAWSEMLGAVMSLKLKMSKTQLVPLAGYSIEEWKAAITDMHGDWCADSVVASARILGVIFGQGQSLVMDATPINRIIERWDF